MKHIGIIVLFSFLVFGLSLSAPVALAQSSDPEMQNTETSKSQARREKRQDRRKGGAAAGALAGAALGSIVGEAGAGAAYGAVAGSMYQ